MKKCEVEIKSCPLCGCKDIYVHLHEFSDRLGRINEDVIFECQNNKCGMRSIFSWFKNVNRPQWTHDVYIALGIHRWNERSNNPAEIGTRMTLTLPEPERK